MSPDQFENSALGTALGCLCLAFVIILVLHQEWKWSAPDRELRRGRQLLKQASVHVDANGDPQFITIDRALSEADRRALQAAWGQQHTGPR